MVWGSLLFTKISGVELKLRLWVDRAAGKRIASRRGIGRIQDLETRSLWLQQQLQLERLTIHKVLGTMNSAAIGTKSLM